MIRVGVIGVGRMGSIHANNLYRNKVKNANLVALCDIDKKLISKLAIEYSDVKTYLSFQSIIEDKAVDAVIIATPHYSHTDIACAFLESGIDVLVEKPVAVTVSEAMRLNDCARLHSDRVLAVMYNQRTNRLYSKAKQLIDSGAIGEIRRINYIISDWYRSQAYYNQGNWRASWSGEGGGALINQCIHQLDILQWLVGMPDSVYAYCNTFNRNITVENEVSALFHYPNNSIASFSARTNELKGTNRLEIAGDKGRLVIGKYVMKHYDFASSEQDVNRSTVEGYGEVETSITRYYYGFRNYINDKIFGQHINIIRNFINTITSQEQLISSGLEGVRAIELINAIYMSDSMSKTVQLPFNAQLYDDLLEKKIVEEATRRRRRKSE